jgi:cephalosporin-C deacetylase
MSTAIPAKPEDFDDYWDAVDRELERYPARPTLRPLPRHSTDSFSVSWVALTSIGPYRIGGYLSVPAGDGPFPALLQTPRHGSVNHVPHYHDRLRYVVLTLMHRGQRLADQPFSASYPGLLTTGVEDPARYIYRAIVADCLRGAEYLMERPEIDTDRTAVVGDDLAMITASRRPGFKYVQVSGVPIQRDALVLHRAIEAAERTSAYPLEEISDYLRFYPERSDAVRRSLAYVDPIHHVSGMTAHLRLDVKESGRVGGPEWVQPLADAAGGPVDFYHLTHEGGTDQDELDAWLARQFGVEPMPTFLRS